MTPTTYTHIYIYCWFLKVKNQEPEFCRIIPRIIPALSRRFFQLSGSLGIRGPGIRAWRFPGLGRKRHPEKIQKLPMVLDGKHMKNIWKIHEDPKKLRFIAGVLSIYWNS